MSEKEFELREFSEHEIRNLVAEELEKLLLERKQAEKYIFEELRKVADSMASPAQVQKLAGVPEVETTVVFTPDSEHYDSLFYGNREQNLELIQEKLQLLTAGQVHQVLSFIENIELEEEVNH